MGPLRFVHTLWPTRCSVVNPTHRYWKRKRAGLITPSQYSGAAALSPRAPTPLPIFFPTSSPSSMAAPNHATQVSAGGYPHARNPIRSSHPPTPLNAEAPRSNERPSIELKISSRGAKILNAVVVDSTGRPLYSISSDESHTKLLSQRDTTNVATID
jgi:hypothetical protein